MNSKDYYKYVWLAVSIPEAKDMLETLLQLVIRLLPKPLKKLWYQYESVWRYCYYGAWTTLLSILTKLAGKWLFGLCGLSLAEHPVANGINTTVSWIICVAFAFVVNKKYVFHSETTERRALLREIGTFVGARGLTYFLEVGLMELPVIFHWGDKGYVIMTVASQFIILAVNYVFSKLVVFRKPQDRADGSESGN